MFRQFKRTSRTILFKNIQKTWAWIVKKKKILYFPLQFLYVGLKFNLNFKTWVQFPGAKKNIPVNGQVLFTG